MTEACHASLRSRLCALTEADQRELYLRAVLVCAGTADCTLVRRRSRTCRKTKPGGSRALVIWDRYLDLLSARCLSDWLRRPVLPRQRTHHLSRGSDQLGIRCSCLAPLMLGTSQLRTQCTGPTMCAPQLQHSASVFSHRKSRQSYRE